MTKMINVNTRLDLLAAQIYNDPTQWKIIRKRNGMTMPFGPLLEVGKIIEIPEK